MSEKFGTFDADAEKIRREGANQSSSGSGGAVDGAKSALSGAQEKAGELSDQASTKVDAGIDKAAGGMDSLASTLRDKTESMGDGPAHTAAAVAADKLASGAELLRGKDTDQLVADLEAFVRSKPVESLLIAFGIGFFLSKSL